MIALVCALLSGVGFYCSIGLGEQWALGWLAPIPVLWLTFGQSPLWRVFAAALAAYAIGGANMLPAYAGVMPPQVLVLAIGAPALLFAVATCGARVVCRRLGPAAGVLAFAALWTAFDFLASFSRAGGTAATPAAAQVGALMLIQTASLVGYVGITFVIGAAAAALAYALRERKPAFALAAIALFAANAAFGYWRMSAPPGETMRVALIASNDAVGRLDSDDEAAALRAINAYAGQLNSLRDRQLDLIVLPENIARVAPGWRDDTLAPLATAADLSHATLVAGFNTHVDGAQRNVAWAFAPNTAPVTYVKRRLVLGLETPGYTPGDEAVVLPNGIGLEICKDMDFQAMIRADIAANRPLLLAVPAWDFVADGWGHARIAILRSVENGVPMARGARAGLLTLNDRYGRLIARTRVGSGFATVVADVPLAERGARTLYNRIGDVFGWACIMLSAGLLAFAFATRRSAKQKSNPAPARASNLRS